eukprot:TRINITY_DN59454_c0_g2_i1.p1 TRINITY_DN59454_c0_g2~~TRINITY_DN59454_c0_g2_i1.p1  ORF type:complete len:433 (-),score=58.55 TRINITY_DN59454_c0_g2_i1:348-1646(-)
MLTAVVFAAVLAVTGFSAVVHICSSVGRADCKSTHHTDCCCAIQRFGPDVLPAELPLRRVVPHPVHLRPGDHLREEMGGGKDKGKGYVPKWIANACNAMNACVQQNEEDKRKEEQKKMVLDIVGETMRNAGMPAMMTITDARATASTSSARAPWTMPAEMIMSGARRLMRHPSNASDGSDATLREGRFVQGERRRRQRDQGEEKKKKKKRARQETTSESDSSDAKRAKKKAAKMQRKAAEKRKQEMEMRVVLPVAEEKTFNIEDEVRFNIMNSLGVKEDEIPLNDAAWDTKVLQHKKCTVGALQSIIRVVGGSTSKPKEELLKATVEKTRELLTKWIPDCAHLHHAPDTGYALVELCRLGMRSNSLHSSTYLRCQYFHHRICQSEASIYMVCRSSYCCHYLPSYCTGWAFVWHRTKLTFTAAFCSNMSVCLL